MITDSDTSLAFYRDLLGFSHVADTPMPIADGGTMHRLNCGESLIKRAIAVPISEVRSGVTIGMVEDPDGNRVEFVEMS